MAMTPIVCLHVVVSYSVDSSGANPHDPIKNNAKIKFAIISTHVNCRLFHIPMLTPTSWGY